MRLDPLAALVICLRFFTRLPVPISAAEITLGQSALPQAVALVPIAGAMVGIVPALVLVGAAHLGLPPIVCALLALAVLVTVTGALHEDGLADCADGFGGGRTRERKLEIMRDSRIGTYGGLALLFSLLLRTACLATIADHNLALAAAILVAGAAWSRALCLVPLVLLPPARGDGAGAAAAMIPRSRFVAAVAQGLVIALLVPAFAGAPPLRLFTACVLTGAAVLAFCTLAKREVGGQTGDVAGATQQVAEIAFWLSLTTA